MSLTTNHKMLLTASITSSQTTITGDHDLGSDYGSMELKDPVNPNTENIEYVRWASRANNGDGTWTYGSCTRDLSTTAIPATSGTAGNAQAWSLGTIATFTVMHDEILNLQHPAGLIFATTAARDTALGANGAATLPYTNVWVTATGLFYKYNLSTAQWTTDGTSTPASNATTTSAGIGQEGTAANNTAHTEIGTSGAPLFMSPKNTVVISAGAGDVGKVPLLNASGILDISVMDTTAGMTGEIRMWTTATPPTSWIICDGSSLLRAGTYAALFAVIGTTFGTVDGTHFTLPDFRGRSPLGSGTGTATGATAHALGSTPTSGVGGEEKHALIEAELAAHTHTISEGSGGGTTNVVTGNQFTASTSTTTGSTGSGTAHNTMSPHTVVNFIIHI